MTAAGSPTVSSVPAATVEPRKTVRPVPVTTGASRLTRRSANWAYSTPVSRSVPSAPPLPWVTTTAAPLVAPSAAMA
ncbi:hypothetical protein ACIU1J_31455 [Azospirillum doebereinerae]|uniref:hypothetical protein n=1 Tax=Azospirillum doebereinerae TaxID=92933 RepID=UPI00384C10E3